MRIYNTGVSDSNSNKDVFCTRKTLRHEATIGMRPPYRFVGRTTSDIRTIEGMEFELVVEKQVTATFMFLTVHKCVIMIFHKSSKLIEINGSEHCQNHHQVIYASEHSRAVAFEIIAFETLLLESAE